MERIRHWFTPAEELALETSSPLTAPSSDSPEEGILKEAPYLLSPAWGLSIFSHIRSMIWTEGLIERGYQQHRDNSEMFKMPIYGSWCTIVSGKYIDEIARASDAYLSFQETLNDQLQLEHVVGPMLSHDHIHLSLIRTLNRNLPALYNEISDETEYALSKSFKKGQVEDGWTSIKAFEFVGNVVYKLNQRAFVGLPLCRDEEWNEAGRKEDTGLVLRAYLLRIFPKSLRGDINDYISRFGSSSTLARDIVAKAIKERISVAEGQRPNDMLSWIIERAPGEEPDPKVVCGALGLLSMVAQSTTSMSLGHALYYLVAYPEYIEDLREEILQELDGEDPTYESLDRMHKLDSFLRESQRLSGIANVTLARVVMQDFTFSNGVCVPAGEMVQAVVTPMHHDPAYYSDPLEFQPWRFYDLARAERSESSDTRLTSKYDVVTPGSTYLTWGLGRHACPGRWYAAMVMKHLAAYLIIHYEFKLPDSAGGKRPTNLCIAGACIPNTKAQLLFRRREQES